MARIPTRFWLAFHPMLSPGDPKFSGGWGQTLPLSERLSGLRGVRVSSLRVSFFPLFVSFLFCFFLYPSSCLSFPFCKKPLSGGRETHVLLHQPFLSSQNTPSDYPFFKEISLIHPFETKRAKSHQIQTTCQTNNKIFSPKSKTKETRRSKHAREEAERARVSTRSSGSLVFHGQRRHNH